MRHVVQVGDMKMGADGDVVVTHALGSCLGLMVYDPVIKRGGMLHAMLPMSKINPGKATANPYMFVDTGVVRLFQELYGLGAKKSRLVVKAAGCASPIGKDEMFKIGKRNYTVLKKLLWKNNVLLDAEDVGGTMSRTVHFHISTGKIMIKSGRKKEYEL